METLIYIENRIKTFDHKSKNSNFSKTEYLQKLSWKAEFLLYLQVVNCNYWFKLNNGSGGRRNRARQWNLSLSGKQNNSALFISNPSEATVRYFCYFFVVIAHCLAIQPLYDSAVSHFLSYSKHSIYDLLCNMGTYTAL